MFHVLVTSKTVKLAGALVGVCVLAGSAFAAGQGSSQQKAVAAKSIVLGKTDSYPDPACTTVRNCQVVPRVTGIQMEANGVRSPFRSKVDGQLVSWWLRLPKLRNSQIETFNKAFGGEPQVRVAVLRRGIRTRYRLVRQSETVNLQDMLSKAHRARFRLPTPLAVKKGDYIGITAVTWMPAFAVNLSGARNSWRASRSRSRCQTPSPRNASRFKRYYKHNDAQLESSTAKRYDCTYETARLIYWARIVPNEDQTGNKTRDR